MKILVLGASPADRARLRIDEEVRCIRTRMNRGRFRRRFQLDYEPAVQTSDLSSHLMRHSPHILHISGHGEARGVDGASIVLEDQAGLGKTVPMEALTRLLQELRGNIRCVVLGSCESQAQARAISQHIDCVIGISGPVDDETSRVFAERFYGALAEGRSVMHAYKIARIDLDVDDVRDDATLTLFVRDGVDADAVVPASWCRPQVLTVTAAAVAALAAAAVLWPSGEPVDQPAILLEHAGDCTVVPSDGVLSLALTYSVTNSTPDSGTLWLRLSETPASDHIVLTTRLYDWEAYSTYVPVVLSSAATAAWTGWASLELRQRDSRAIESNFYSIACCSRKAGALCPDQRLRR